MKKKIEKQTNKNTGMQQKELRWEEAATSSEQRRATGWVSGDERGPGVFWENIPVLHTDRLFCPQLLYIFYYVTPNFISNK